MGFLVARCRIGGDRLGSASAMHRVAAVIVCLFMAGRIEKPSANGRGFVGQPGLRLAPQNNHTAAAPLTAPSPGAFPSRCRAVSPINSAISAIGWNGKAVEVARALAKH